MTLILIHQRKRSPKWSF